jgi:serine protease Do
MARCLLCIGLAVIACSSPALGAHAAPAAGWSATAQVNPDFVELVRREGATVVNISSTRGGRSAAERERPELSPEDPRSDLFRRFSPPDALESQQLNVGSGFVISEDGYILTNAHLVALMDEATVKLRDRREFKARVVGLDPYTDIALIKIEATGLRKVKIGAPASLDVGEWVAAIGSPFGFENSVTAGIVSAMGRYLRNESHIPFIQTDVAVNPGNSGGPLFNLRGEVVGINSMIYSATGGYMGLSFAVPIDVAMKVAADLRAHGRVTRGRLGLRLQNLSPELAASFGLKDVTGALVVSVERSGPADAAGFRAGDVVLSANDRAITSSNELLRTIDATPPGRAAQFEVWRRGAKTRLEAVVGDLGPRPKSALARQPQEESRVERIGLTLIELTAHERQELETDGALLVRSASGAAGRAGIRQGDVILAINDVRVDRIADVNRALGALAPGSVVALLVMRDDSRTYVAVRLAG